MRSREQLVADLSSQGLRFRTFTVEHDSPRALADWDWNQRDLSHIPLVHGGFRFTPIAVDEDRALGFYLQRILGVRVPLLVHFAHPTPASRLYQTTLGPLTLIIEASLEPLPSGTRVRTTYSLGAAPWLGLALPLIERFLRANYQRLHDEDEPLRARRAELRAWGYRFAADGEGAGYRRSLDLSRANVIAPDSGGAVARAEAALDLDDGAREWRVGRDDHVGLRVVRDGAVVRVFPRLCAHEGASLDGCDARDGVLRCPWHGRRVAPLCTLALDQPPSERRLAHHRLRLDGRRLRISPD